MGRLALFSQRAKVKKFVKTVYQQFLVGTTFQTQNGLV